MAPKPPLVAPRHSLAAPPRAPGGLGGHVGAPQVNYPGAFRLAAARRPARVPSSRLPPVLLRPARLADRDVDAVGGAGVARARADEFGVPPGPRGHAAIRADARPVVL